MACSDRCGRSKRETLSSDWSLLGEFAKQGEATQGCSNSAAASCVKRAAELIGSFVFLMPFEKTRQPGL
jgi:hypothetical protein